MLVMELAIFKYDFKLSSIASELKISREFARQVFDVAIKKVLNSRYSLYFFGSDTNLQLAIRKRNIAIGIFYAPYSDLYINFYSFFSPFYTALEVDNIIAGLSRDVKNELSGFNDIGTSRNSRLFNLHSRKLFFRIIESVFDQLIDKYGWRNIEDYNEQFNILGDVDNSFSVNKVGLQCIGVYDCVETSGYLRWQIDEILRELTDEEIALLHKVYGPYFDCPTSACSRNIVLDYNEKVAVLCIKSKIRTLLYQKQRSLQENSLFSLAYEDYCSIVEHIKYNCVIDTDINSDRTKVNMIVFLYLGIGESKPMSIDMLAKIFNMTTCDVRSVILNYLRSFKTGIKIDLLFRMLIEKIEKLQDRSDLELSVWPVIPKTSKRRKCKNN